MAQDNNTGKPNNSQMLRDKLNQSLKQRLGRRTEAAQDGGAFAPDPASTPFAEAENYSPPATSPAQSKAKSSKDRDFLDELAKEVDVEISLMGNFAPFMETIDNDDKARQTQPGSVPVEIIAQKKPATIPAPEPKAPAVPTAPTAPPSPPPSNDFELRGGMIDESSLPPDVSHSSPLFSGSPATIVSSDSQGLKVMQEEPKNNDSSSSLRDLLKSGKSDSKSSGSSLKAPRQSSQSTNNTNSSNEDASSDSSTQSNDGEEYPKRDAFLKAPRPSKQQSSTQASEDNDIPASHEQEILHAIRRGDADWITQNAQIALIDKARHEIITTLSLSQPQCLEALFAAGLPVDKNGGLALRTATQKKDYAALEVLKAMGVRVDLETLKALAAWRRASSRKEKTTAEAEDAKANAVRIQSDFDDFLQAHADELGIDDPSKFAPKDEAPGEAAKGEDDIETPEYEAEVPVDLLSELEVALSSNTINPDLATPSLDSISEQDSQEASKTPAKTKPEQSRRLGSEATAPNAPKIAPSNPDLGAANAPHKSSVRFQPTESLEPPMTAQTPPSSSNDRKSSNVSSQGMSPMDKVKLATFDKVMQEKQLLEMKVMELQMYQDAAASMEEERNKLLDELAEAQEQKDNAEFELEETKKEFSQFDTIKTQLEAQLAQEKASSKLREEAHARERDRLMAAESNTASLLRDAERREGELRQGQQQLLAKIAELEKRGTPAPEANDWLEGTEKEANLRKGLFVEAILGGEYKTLGKISMNTAVEPEMAHLALVFAAEAGQLKCAQWLVDNMDVHPGFGGELALMRAIKHNHFDMIRWLAGNGADIHHADEFALRLAVDKDDVAMLDFLVSLGANVRAANERALREAAKGQSWSCFKALLGYGCTGLDQKGEPHPELAYEEEATERLQWIAAQRKLAKTLDPDFAKRQKRKDI